MPPNFQNADNFCKALIAAIAVFHYHIIKLANYHTNRSCQAKVGRRYPFGAHPLHWRLEYGST